jgi:hypothetical protein
VGYHIRVYVEFQNVGGDNDSCGHFGAAEVFRCDWARKWLMPSYHPKGESPQHTEYICNSLASAFVGGQTVECRVDREPVRRVNR